MHLSEQLKYGLALHTTTPELGLAISDFVSDKRFSIWNLERDLSSQLHQYLIQFIQPQVWKDIGFIAVAKGPGGFTGTRIGVVTARTLGQQLDIPVFAISTMAAFAWSYFHCPINQENETKVVALQMPAQRGQIFAAIYQLASDDVGLTTLLEDTVFTKEIWQEKLAAYDISYQLVEVKSGVAATVTSILQLAYLEWQQGKRPNWSQALPYYGQHPVE